MIDGYLTELDWVLIEFDSFLVVFFFVVLPSFDWNGKRTGWPTVVEVVDVVVGSRVRSAVDGARLSRAAIGQSQSWETRHRHNSCHLQTSNKENNNKNKKPNQQTNRRVKKNKKPNKYRLGQVF